MCQSMPGHVAECGRCQNVKLSSGTAGPLGTLQMRTCGWSFLQTDGERECVCGETLFMRGSRCSAGSGRVVGQPLRAWLVLQAGRVESMLAVSVQLACPPAKSPWTTPPGAAQALNTHTEPSHAFPAVTAAPLHADSSHCPAAALNTASCGL